MNRYAILVFLTVVSCFPMAGEGVLFYSTGDPSYNTNAPAGALEGSGWQFQGCFLQYLGTPIAPHHFVTAKHFGGTVGSAFHYHGEVYTTITNFTDSGSDLRLWEIDGTFDSYAPIYSGSDEVGAPIVVFGRGVDRGAAVTNTLTTGHGPNRKTQVITNGWKWGAYNYVQRWGTNLVMDATTSFIIAEWDKGGGDNECMLTDKDSGGAIFIQDGSVWKLAGINYGIGPGWTYSFSSDGSNSFNASILDFRGDENLYVKQGDDWNLVPNNYKSYFLSTRVSSRYNWITNNIPDFDQDVDGLPDWWETEYGGDPTSMESGVDLDGDGFSNYEEWLADTVPTNGNSFLEITDYSTATDLTFNSSTNRKYQVQYRMDLVDINEIWQTEVDWISGAYPQTTLPVSTVSSNRFYRVRAKVR